MPLTPATDGKEPQPRTEIERDYGIENFAARPGSAAQDGLAPTRRLLVVDDDPSVRSVVTMMTERMGFFVEVAGDGREALTLLQKESNQTDLVLTDVNMPVMDGLALVRAIGQLAEPPAIAVMSGRFDEFLRASFRAAGVTVLINKPFSGEDLGLALDRLQPSVD